MSSSAALEVQASRFTVLGVPSLRFAVLEELALRFALQAFQLNIRMDQLPEPVRSPLAQTTLLSPVYMRPLTRITLYSGSCKHTNPDSNPGSITHLQRWVEPKLQSELESEVCEQLAQFVSGLGAAN